MTRKSIAGVAAAAVVLGSAMVAVRASQSTEVGVVIRFAIEQPNAPIVVLGHESSVADGAYAFIKLRNASARAVRAIELGVFAHGGDGGDGSQLIARKHMAIDMAATSELRVASNLVPFKLMNSLRPSGQDLVLEAGVIGVTFADGSAWSYDVEKAGRFSKNAIRRDTAGGLCGSETGKAILGSAGMVLERIGLTSFGFFRCDPTSDPIWCENHLETCEGHICDFLPNCPRQECKYVSSGFDGLVPQGSSRAGDSGK